MGKHILFLLTIMMKFTPETPRQGDSSSSNAILSVAMPSPFGVLTSFFGSPQLSQLKQAQAELKQAQAEIDQEIITLQDQMEGGLKKEIKSPKFKLMLLYNKECALRIANIVITPFDPAGATEALRHSFNSMDGGPVAARIGLQPNETIGDFLQQNPTRALDFRGFCQQNPRFLLQILQPSTTPAPAAA